MISYSSTIFHRDGPSIEERINLTVVDVQSGLFGLSVAFKELDEQIVHADVIIHHVISENVQIQGHGTRDSRWHLNRFLF